MLMKKIAAFIVVAGLLVGGEVMADAYDWEKTGKIQYISIQTGRVNIVLEGSPTLCTTSNGGGKGVAQYKPGVDVPFRLEDKDINRILSVAMAAYMSGKSVKIAGMNNPNGWGCLGGFISLQP